MDLLEKSLDGYDPVDTTSHIDLNFTDPDSITSIAPPEDSITSIAPPKDSIISIATPEESIVTQYKVLLDAAAKLAPQVNNLPNPHNLTTHLAIYHQGLLVKKLVKTFNSALETDSRLKPLYNHIWYGSDQLDFTFEWNYCKDQVQKRLYDIYKADMKEFVGIGQVFYEKYHLEKVNFIYTPLVKEVDGDIHQVLGGEETGTEYVSLIPGLTRGGKPLVTEILCPI